MGRDYSGRYVEGSEGPLADALTGALPTRFDWRGAGVDLPWFYASALVEAAVAAATRADEPYDPDSPSVQSVIDSLVRTVQQLPQATVAHVAADIDVERSRAADGERELLGETLEIAGVRIIRVATEPERFIESELPSAGYEVERDVVFVYPGPASLLVSSEAAWASYEARVVTARTRLTVLMDALRLATATSAHPVADLEGTPTLPLVGPAITPLPQWGFRFVHRATTLRASDVPGIEALIALIKSWGDEPRWIPMRIAIRRLGRSLDGRSQGAVDQTLDLAIGLEATLAGTDKDEISLRLRSRAARLLEVPDDPAANIYRDVKTLYNLRSTFVHGGNMTDEQVINAVSRITGADASEAPGEQYLLALDRWRDLLRRAILARIALASATPPWLTKGGAALDIDEFLLRNTDRAAWVSHIADFWRDLGLPDAPGRAVSATLWINRRPTGPPDEQGNAQRVQ